jgi:hypothetical protein
MILDAVAFAKGPWWLIGSAAVALHAADVIVANDVDLLMTEEDAATMLKSLGIPPLCKPPHAIFRSTVLGLWNDPPLPVEIMGGFECGTNGVWKRVWPRSRQRIPLGNRAVFAPSADELRTMLVEFGRPKDLERARMLEV